MKYKSEVNFESSIRSCVKIEVVVLGLPSLIVYNYGLRGRKANTEFELLTTLHWQLSVQ